MSIDALITERRRWTHLRRSIGHLSAQGRMADTSVIGSRPMMAASGCVLSTSTTCTLTIGLRLVTPHALHGKVYLGCTCSRKSMATVSSLPSDDLTRSLEHPSKLGVGVTSWVLAPGSSGRRRTQSLVVRNFAGQDKVGVIAQREVRLHTVIDGLNVGAADRLRLVQDEVLVLPVLAQEVLLVVQVKVGLH